MLPFQNIISKAPTPLSSLWLVKREGEGCVSCGKRKNLHLGCFLSYMVCNTTLPSFLSLHLMLSLNAPLPIVISKTPLSFLYITTTGHVAKRHQSPSILQKPPSPLFICIPSQSKSYKYPLSFSLSSFTSPPPSLLPAASNREATRERAPSLAPFDHQTPPPTPSLHHFVRTGRSFRIVAVFLLRRQNLGPVPSFWIGTELPFVGRDKDLDRRVFSLNSCLLTRVFFLAKT